MHQSVCDLHTLHALSAISISLKQIHTAMEDKNPAVIERQGSLSFSSTETWKQQRQLIRYCNLQLSNGQLANLISWHLSMPIDGHSVRNVISKDWVLDWMNYTVFYKIHITNALSKESIPFILVCTTKEQMDNQLTTIQHW